MRNGIAVGMVSALVLAGCASSHAIDRAAWSKDLASVGKTVNDWDKYERVMREVCEESQDDLALFVAQGLDQGQSGRFMEINFTHACPDRLPDFNAAMTSVASAVGASKQACETPADRRTTKQQQLAEAQGC